MKAANTTTRGNAHYRDALFRFGVLYDGKTRDTDLDGRALLALEAARQVAAVRLRRCAAINAVCALIDVDVAALALPRVPARAVVHLMGR